jgi:glyoxylase-like metal-dependent hydrolase (beta-lactamase superfamily II)
MSSADPHARPPALKLAVIPVTPFQQNCSLVVCGATNEAALVDPGGEVDRLLAAVAKSGARLTKVLVTHGHIDHCGGVAEMAERAGVPIEGPHPDESFWIDQLDQQGRMFGVPGARRFTPDR